MFCPQCHAEYRPGFTHCTDCDVDLVYELANEERERFEQHVQTWMPAEALDGEDFRPLVQYESSLTCADRCLILQEAGIPYRVKELPHCPGLQLEPRNEFQIFVLHPQFERAKELLGIQIAYGEEPNFPNEAEIQAAMELPARDDLAVEENHSDYSPNYWYPEDATVKIWSGDVRKKGETIELSLRENRINFRSEAKRDNLRIFVAPEDEARAKEIVREVVEGAPPE
jgi:hypothetical protein